MRSAEQSSKYGRESRMNRARYKNRNDRLAKTARDERHDTRRSSGSQESSKMLDLIEVEEEDFIFHKLNTPVKKR